MDIDNCVPLLVRHVLDHPVPGEACHLTSGPAPPHNRRTRIVYEDVNRAELGVCLAENLHGKLRIHHVASYRDRRSSLASDAAGNLLGYVGPDVVDNDSS
eukprot:764248-Hanusia_phi.AAC.1